MTADKDSRVRFSVSRCTLGLVLVAAGPQGVCAVSLGEDRPDMERELRGSFPLAEPVADGAEFADIIAGVIAAVENPAVPADFPLHIRGTAFQEKVWTAIRAIPAGVTRSYSDVAARIGQPDAARAVASACAANTIAVLIPCHRVVCGDGSLSGYRWGVERKREILRREAA